MTKQLSDADVALFTLVTTDQPPAGEEPAAAQRETAEAVVPNALVMSLLAATALAHAGGAPVATLTHVEVSCVAAAHTEDTLTAAAEVLAADPATRTLRVRVHCTNQTGARLAEGTFDLRAE